MRGFFRFFAVSCAEHGPYEFDISALVVNALNVNGPHAFSSDNRRRLNFLFDAGPQIDVRSSTWAHYNVATVKP